MYVSFLNPADCQRPLDAQSQDGLTLWHLSYTSSSSCRHHRFLCSGLLSDIDSFGGGLA